jgi:hypothetical protein
VPSFDGAALLTALAERQVSYVIVGGFAVIAHGVIRTTSDLDICPDPSSDNLRRLAALLEAADAVQVGVGDFKPEEMPLDPRRPEDLAQGGNFRLTTRFGALDIMQWLSGIDADHAYPVLARDAVDGTVGGVSVRVASLEALRRMKRAAGRAKDLDDLRQLDLAHRGTDQR